MISPFFASTSAFIPLIKVPPIAAPACNITITGTKDPIHVRWGQSSQDMTALICYYVTHFDWWCSWWLDVPSVCNYYAESMFRLAVSPQVM